MGSGITFAEGLEVSHRNIVQVEFGGTHSTDPPAISAGYIKVVSTVSIYVFYKRKLLHSMTVVLDKEALSSGGSQSMDLDISLILAEADG